MKVLRIVENMKPKLVDGTLPDIDQDLAAKDRAEIKSYMEKRFGEEQVCSIGTFTTLKAKGLIKDLARVMSIDFKEVNIITSLIKKEDASLLDIIQYSLSEPKLKNFIKENSDIFYILPSLLGQHKTNSIHACAMIVFPSVMSSQEWVPMRMQKGLMVSEWQGGEIDDAGFLKEDILGIKQLDKFDAILKLIESNGKQVPEIYNLPDDKEVYRYFGNGWNGDVFQFGTDSLSDYTKAMKPRVIDDLIAANALYRPGPIENGFHLTYIKCKNKGQRPDYLWGTENITKDTYGILIYQEQIMQIFQELGGLSMKEADDVRRAIGKKKLDVIKTWRSRVEQSFLDKGATPSEFLELWEAILEFAKYSFNKSHSAAYAVTGYISQYLKVNFPIEYWTVALDFGSDSDTLKYLSEILQSRQIEVRPPDINRSGTHMSSDQNTSTIFWGIESIKGIGETTAEQIIEERVKNGDYLDFEDFYFRHKFKGSKVKKQTFEALISSGAFDSLEQIDEDIENRMDIIEYFREEHKVKPTKTDPYTKGEIGERWWWGLHQKNITGLANIDYKKILIERGICTEYCLPNELIHPQERGIFRSFGGYVVESRIGKSKKGKYARLTIEHNYKLFKLMIWAEEYSRLSNSIKGSEKN